MGTAARRLAIAASAVILTLSLSACAASGDTDEAAQAVDPSALTRNSTCSELVAVSVNDQGTFLKSIKKGGYYENFNAGSVIKYCAANLSDTVNDAIRDSEGVLVPDDSDDAGAIGPLLRAPISDSDGFEAVVLVDAWEEVDAYDVSACPSIQFPQGYLVEAVEISGRVEYPEVNGLTWSGPIELIGGSITGASVTEPSSPVVVATCATPVSSPNSASKIPTLQDSAWVVAPATEFAITVLYASEMTPNNPAGRFGEAGPMTQLLALPNVMTDCGSLNGNGFIADDAGGYCTVTRTAELTP